MNEPKTVVEKFDAAQDGKQFAAALGQLFSALEEAMADDDE